MPEEDIYDAVYQEDEQEIYDDLCALKEKPSSQVLVATTAEFAVCFPSLSCWFSSLTVQN